MKMIAAEYANGRKLRDIASADDESELHQEILKYAERHGFHNCRASSGDMLPEISEEQFDKISNDFSFEIYKAVQQAGTKSPAYHKLASIILKEIDSEQICQFGWGDDCSEIVVGTDDEIEKSVLFSAMNEDGNAKEIRIEEE